MQTVALPDHDQIQNDADAMGLGVDAAELHGSLCGLLCGGGVVQRAEWLRQLALDPGQAALLPESALDRLYLCSEQQLNDPDYGFELLLPSAKDLAARADALLAWCRGFLGGFGLSAGGEPDLSDEASEALNDLAGIAATELDDDEDEVDEESLTEIEEFVRVAALLLYSDANRAGDGTGHRLH